MAYRSSTSSGTSALVSSRATNVPANTAANDIVVCLLYRWESINPAVTPPAGFTHFGTQINQGAGSTTKLDLFYKNLSGADAGTYSFSWTGSMWTTLDAVCFSGCTGTPSVVASGTVASGTALPSVSGTSTTAADLIYFEGSDNGGTLTAPTGYTLRIYDDASGFATRDAVAAGTQTISGGSYSTSTWQGAYLIQVDNASTAVTATLPRMSPPGRIAPGGLWTPLLGDTTAATSVLYQVSVGGTLTPTGAPVRAPSKALAGASTPTGSLVRQANKVPSGSLTPAGALTRSTAKDLAGSLTPAGALATIRLRVLALAGSLTPAGSLVRQSGKALGGVLTPAGALTRQAAKALAGALTPAGAVTNIRTRLLSVAGSLTPTGSLVRQSGKALGGGLTPSGSLVRSVGKVLTGALTPTGALASTRIRILALAGSLTPTGAPRRSVGKAVAGELTPSGALVKRAALSLAGALTPSGAAAKLLARVLHGTVTPAGSTTAENLGVVVPVIDYPLRAGSLVDLAQHWAARVAVDLAARHRAGTATDEGTHYRGGTPS